MRKEMTMEHIRANLIKEYGTKPQRKGILWICAGILVALFCFLIVQLAGVFIGILFAVIGFFQYWKAKKMKQKIGEERLNIREGRCIEKKIKSGAGGTKRYFYFTKKSYYIAGDQDIRLWEKTHIGDKFYLISFEDSKEVKKIYPQRAVKYVEE